MSYPGTSHAPTRDCRDCGGECYSADLTDGLCPTCDAANYRRNQL